jgi:PAS domain S-box-containing protein
LHWSGNEAILGGRHPTFPRPSPVSSDSQSALLEELRVSEEELRVQAEQLAMSQVQTIRERQRYHDLFENAPVPYLITDRDGTIRQVNQAGAVLLHCPQERLRGKPLATFVPLEMRPHFRRQLQQINDARDVTRVALRLTPRLGGERTLVGTVGVARDGDGPAELRWLLIPGTTSDAPALAPSSDDQNEELDDRRARAERSARDMGDLLAWVSHELRTPVASIGGYSDILALGVRGMLTPDQQAILVRIQQAQTHLIGLLDDLGTFARAGTGNLRFEIGDVALEPIFDYLQTIVEPQAAARDLRLMIDVPSGIIVRGDSERVLQILLNLVTNSVKFTPAGGSINVSCDPGEDLVVLRVRDSGTGVPEEARERIFRPYVQLHASRKAQPGGFGLGLAISREFARTMGGDLTCTDASEGGSVFVLRLPRSTGIAAPKQGP